MSTAFSPVQLRASLWAHENGRVHAVIDGLVVPGIAEKLQVADVAGWDCLQRGALTAGAAQREAYLAELKPASPFTDWLLEEATPAFPGWGVLTVSGCALLQIREHCRSIGEVITPDGERRAWRWHDPDVLRTVLPTLLAGKLDELFTGVQAFVIAEPQAWTWLAMEKGLLSTDRRPLMPASR